jgi:hypothetical protein
MAQGQKFDSFKEFWPEYLRLHSKPVTRAVHYAGTLGGLVLAAAGAIVGAPLLIVAAPIFTYALLFPAHPLFEKNRPATFKNPVMSIGGDFKMLFCFLTGRIDSEFKKYGLDPTGKTGNNQNDPSVARPAPAAQNKPSFFLGTKNKLKQAFSLLKANSNDNAPVKTPAPALKKQGPAPG